MADAAARSWRSEEATLLGRWLGVVARHVGPLLGALTLSALALVGCGRSTSPDAFVPLARSYVAAFNDHDWTKVCRMGPRHSNVSGFGRPQDCERRMHRKFARAEMRYGFAITGAFVGTATSPAPRPYRTFLVHVGHTVRVLTVVTENGTERIFLYEDS